ncbi:hypothetical protein B0H13DRAFT_1942519 [Mycena leptocephala]|nr:hypothetical protein B0H13DRAFT_1942519 [Mycena leptocephala]
MPSPNPILKRARSANEAPHPSVHFPPSPSLTRTFSAHSSAHYDRTPIQVSPNACALPARGCPGRTYYDGAPSRKPSAKQHPTTGRGATLHPRALAAYEAALDEDDDEDDDSTEAERTPTRTSPYIPLPVPPPIPSPNANAYSHYSLSTSSFSSLSTQYPTYLAPQPPPLVPDLSSESDESDGFASPPPELALPPGPMGGGKYSSAGYPYVGYPSYPYPSHSYPASYGAPSPYAPPNAAPYPYAHAYAPPPISSTSPYHHPHPQSPSQTPPSPPLARRRPSPRRPQTPFARGVGAEEEDGYEEEDLPGEYSHAGAFAARDRTRRSGGSPPRERKARSAAPSTTSAYSYSTPSSPPAAPALSESPPRDRERKTKDKTKRDGTKDGNKERCRVSTLCRTLKGTSFRDGEGEGCLGGF